MQTQVIPQQQFFIEGIPANKYGEWSGIKSNKWKGSIRVIRPKDRENILNDNSSMPLIGKRHFSQTRSDEMLYKPEKKMFTELRNRTEIETKKLGLKTIHPVFSERKIHFSKRLYEPRYGEKKDGYRFQVKTFNPDGNYRTYNEFPLEHDLGGKRRIESLSCQRNGMPQTAPGDKCFKNPEYSTDFFKEGGLIPGSSNRLLHNRNVSKRADNFYQTLDMKKGCLNPNKLWTNKVRCEEKDFDVNYVKTLTIWEKNVLGDLPKPPDVVVPQKGKGQPTPKSPIKKK